MLIRAQHVVDIVDRRIEVDDAAAARYGLDRSDVAAALLGRTLGVEIGQLFFVLLILALERAFRVLEIHWPRAIELFPGYAVGSLGAYWTIQRTLMLVGGLR